MKYPILIADNFFENLNKVKNFALEISDREKSNNGSWPGERSKPTHLINHDFFKYVCAKILAMMFPFNWKKIYYNANQQFQYIKPSNYDLGFIHRDNEIADFTAIIYLSSHEDCGTNFYSLKNNFFSSSIDEYSLKEKFYLDVNNQKKRKEAYEACIQHSKFFDETIKINSKPNRILIFDSNYFHSAQNFKDVVNKNEDRLTLITFFNKIFIKEDQFAYPLVESRCIV